VVGPPQIDWAVNHGPMPYMYILECSDRSLYVGSTRNLEHRLAQHGDGEGAAYTRNRLPVRLLYFEEFDRVDDAYRREKQVQGWGRAKRLALVKGQLEKLATLARKDFGGSAEGNVSRET
jgi:putative endonuclease